MYRLKIVNGRIFDGERFNEGGLYIEDGRIAGDLDLAPYDPKDEKSRETQISSWLSSMQW